MEEIISKTATLTDAAQASDKDKKRLRRWKWTLIFSFAAGIISALAGLILGAVSYTNFFRSEKALNQIGNLLIVAAFPLMMLGAHALDKIGEIKRHSTNMPHHWKD